ncbi:hypothetical protein CY34DRAFT_53149, partial [Suillus luteus UH-Slu-Lm8-n1]
FPPVLFLSLIEDKSLKTVFGNWELLAQILKALLHGVASLHQESSGGGTHTDSLKWGVHQIMPGSIVWAAVIVIFSLSPDTEFSSTGTGKKSNICYWNLFHLYKKVLVTKWTTKHIVTIITSINHYIFKAAKTSTFNAAEQDDHADAINHALVVLNMDSDSESDAELNNPFENPKATSIH